MPLPSVVAPSLTQHFKSHLLPVFATSSCVTNLKTKWQLVFAVFQIEKCKVVDHNGFPCLQQCWSNDFFNLFFTQVLNLENQLVEIELERNKYARTHDISSEHVKQIEENRKLLADEFVALKKKALNQEENLTAQVWKLDCNLHVFCVINAV